MGEDNIKITEENKALLAQLEKEQGSVSVYHDKQAKCTASIASLEKELAEAQATLTDKEQERQEALAGKKDLEAENLVIRKDIDDVNMSIQKLEQEKTNRDHTIRSLQDEVANQDEIINKLNKEKKHVSESAAKSAEDLQCADDKVSHMSNVVKKLESTLDELEGSLEKEKRGRAQVEKERRKVEGDLKIAQETLADLERNKRELEGTLERKDKDASALMSKLEDEQALVAKVQKSIKEHQARVEELESELEAERQARAKAERQRSDLAREMENMGERLNEATGATAAQIELNKKREAEVGKLRKDLEEANIQQEAVMGNLKRKQGDATGEMSEQVDTLQKIKARIDKDKIIIMHEIADIRAATDEVARSQASSEKTYRGIQSTLGDMGKKIEKANLTLADYASGQRKVAAENADILRQLQEAENNANMLAKLKVGLNEQLSDAQSQANHEAKERQILLGKYRNIEHEVAGLKDAFDEEMSSRDNLLRQLSKLEGEAELLRVRYEKEGLAKAEELEMAQLKMQARLGEAESTIDLKSAKLAQLEKAKAKSQADLDAMATQVDQAQILNASMDKRAK